MKITAVQMAPILGEVEKNYQNARRWICRAAAEKADVVVLPELWNTSFYPADVETLADEEGIRTKTFLSSLAAEYHVNIVGGSAAVRRGQRIYNTTYVADRNGTIISTYDKVHLFTPGREDAKFSAGSRSNCFMLDGIMMASVICYDVRFPEWVRTAALGGAQVLFVPAAWPGARIDHWQILNRARAIENQMFVAAVNNCGAAGAMQFGGHSLIAGPWGDIAAMGGTEEELVQADIDISSITAIRSSMNVFRDRRPELYGAAAHQGE